MQFDPSDESESIEEPNWPEELIEPIRKLGRPLAYHRTSRKQASRRATMALALILVGILANYLYFVQFKLPPLPDKFIFLILFGPPLAGLLLIYRSYRDRGMWIVVYPMGLLHWHRKEVTTFPWVDVRAVHFHSVNKEVEIDIRLSADGTPVEATLDISQAGSTIFGSRLHLAREDGTAGYIPSSLTNYHELVRLIQIKTFELHWPRIWERHVTGSTNEFHLVEISLLGLRKINDSLPWIEFGNLSINGGKVSITKLGKWRSWFDMPLELVPNPHIFWTLIRAANPMPVILDEDDDD
jgi:hypothetical protein